MEATEPDLDAPAIAGAATEEAMGTLHGAVAKVLTTALTDPGEDGVSPQLVGAAIAFLKNNNITASPSRNKDLAALKDTLGKRRQRKEITRKGLDEAAQAFEQMQGASGLPN